MTFIAEVFFSGCISKVINDGKDYSWTKIKSVINDRDDRNLSTRIYRVIEKALIKVADRKFKGTDILYETIEKIFIEFREHGSTIESVKCGLGMLNSNVTVERCENFLEKFYEGICQDDDLYKVISLMLQEKGIDINQKEFQKINETVGYGFAELNKKMDKIDEKINIRNKNDIEENSQSKELVKSRTQEYADKWNDNMFLNNFDEWDENAGVNVKLGDVYIDKHLPCFILGRNGKEYDNLRNLLSTYILNNDRSKMLLILGQPGIGKSTLITWIIVNFKRRINDILVYKFASDLKKVDWKSYNVFDKILETIGVSHEDLDGKTLIIDGFDEINVRENRKEILDKIYRELVYKKIKNKFSLIITCRENYISNIEKIDCEYIILQPWKEEQIESFCTVFQQKTFRSISEEEIGNIIRNKEVMGIPLILYMILALDISVEKESSVVDVYDKIFSLDGGIYDRCVDNKSFDDFHWIRKIKGQVHQVSKEIAIWMFENNPNEASIPQKEYKEICDRASRKINKRLKKDILIGNFFKIVRHCEGIEAKELYFIHRSIYEYFVSEIIYSLVKSSLMELTKKSQKKFACNIVVYLKKGEITNTIGEYIRYKIIKLYYGLDNRKQEEFKQWWKETIDLMTEFGMFYFTDNKIKNYKNIISKEVRCFLNLLKISQVLSEISHRKYILGGGDNIKRYIEYCVTDIGGEAIDLSYLFLEKINLRGAYLKGATLVEVDLKEADLMGAYLLGANLKGADLRRANLNRANLFGADLTHVKFERADLRGANLEGADLSGISLSNAYIEDSIWEFEDIPNLYSELKKADFTKIIIVKGVAAYYDLYKRELFNKS